ncbi:BZ3500_MvSof-1268-A1-R1_Chr5-2g08003 [Microbotryum saponariae]|uniref:BZ3500_MvSof-1268-A1-R1_Chr5-2g08003 protein n=1 Tax=Microbotryum saponariae TaxID=289078 RepID=A0A2X0NE71_9BASI|nr:BZ3500_MvSof-1268-A1-R1_Chr5-2g08003 [Microbotryum saponariae]SDA05872.1 BZ3501_MvSof-1269-A2-R1_Chr5-2g07825 [Microbotryum saponariae]
MASGYSQDKRTATSNTGSTMSGYPHDTPSTSMLAADEDDVHVSPNSSPAGGASSDKWLLLPQTPPITLDHIGNSPVHVLSSSPPFESLSSLRRRASMAMSSLPQTRRADGDDQISVAGETDLQRDVRSESMGPSGRPHCILWQSSTLSSSVFDKGKGVAVVEEERSPDCAVTEARAPGTDAEQVGQRREHWTATSTGVTASQYLAGPLVAGLSQSLASSSERSMFAQDDAHSAASSIAPWPAPTEILRLDPTPTPLAAAIGTSIDGDEGSAASNTGWATPCASTSEMMHISLTELSIQLTYVERMQNDLPSPRAQFSSHRAKPPRRFSKSFTTALSRASPSSRTRPPTPFRLDSTSSLAGMTTSASASPLTPSPSPARNGGSGARHRGELLELSTSEASSASTPFVDKSPSSDIFRVRARSRSLPVMLQKPLRVTPVVQVDSRRAKELNRLLESDFVTVLSSPTLESSPVVDSDSDPQSKPRDIFGTLPYEVQARILCSLVHIHIDEHERLVADGKWRGPVVLRTRWRGEASGRRELVKCARVSRLWRNLAFDGQTWPILDVASIGPDVFSSPALLRLAEGAGTFVRKVDLSNMAQTTGYTIVEMTRLVGSERGQTNLTSINLQGCSSISNSSLAFLLARSPNLRKLNFLALAAVDDETLRILGKSAQNLEDLNVSRCSVLHATSLYFITSPLKRLGASRMHSASDRVIGEVLRRQTALESLDLSSSHRLTDQVFQSNTSLSSLDALRHLNLSSCRLLTDETLACLVDHVPHLETFEIAYNRQIGANDALKRLLHSTPLLKRLDLEGSIVLEDAALSGVANCSDLPELEWLVLSGCTTLTQQCLASIARSQGLPKLKILELDGTHIDEVSIASFVIRQHQKHLQPFSPQLPSPDGSLPCSAQELPSKISILDAHFHTRRLQRQLSRHIRTRDGRRGYEFRHFAYADFDTVVPQESTWSINPAIQELEGSTRVVLRSFEGNADVDGLHSRTGPSRARTWSGSGRTGCIVS